MIKLLLAAAAAVAPAPAQPPEPTPSAKWVSHWGDGNCWLIRSAEAPAGSVLAIKRMPGNDMLTLSIVDPAWKKAPNGKAPLSFALHPDGQAIEGEATFIPNSPYVQMTALHRARLSLSTRDRSVAQRLSGAGAVSVNAEGKEIARATLPTMEKAIDALRSCEADALRAWGVDPTAWKSLRSGPYPDENAMRKISNKALPPKLLRGGGSAEVLARLRIDETGKPTDCVVLEQKGSDDVGRTTCSLMLKSGRFHPAIGADGNPVAADYIHSDSWMVTVSITRG